jgi:hypothetical protein
MPQGVAMPKVTIKPDGTKEISELTFEEVKELAGLNGHATNGHAPSVPTRRGRPRRTTSYVVPTSNEPDYKHFYRKIGERGRKFFAVLKQNPNGLSGEVFAEKIGFSTPSQIGGLAGANLKRHANQFNVDLTVLYVREREKLDTGEWRTTYKPGPEIAILQ